MNRLSISVLLLFAAISTHAQILQPVKWSYAAKKLNKSEAVVFLKATIDADWHLYSQHIGEGGPVKTSFTFQPSANYQLSGTTVEPKPITKFEKTFNMNVSYFEKSVVFQQKIKLKDSKPVTVKGKLEYMVCNDQQCLPPDEVEFSIPVK